MPRSDIATLELVAVTDGERRPVQLRLGRPTPDGDDSWACPIALDGMHPGLLPMVGGDSLQALCLALALAASLLRDSVAHGTRLEYAAGGEFPLDAYFGFLGSFEGPPGRQGA